MENNNKISEGINKTLSLIENSGESEEVVNYTKNIISIIGSGLHTTTLDMNNLESIIKLSTEAASKSPASDDIKNKASNLLMTINGGTSVNDLNPLILDQMYKIDSQAKEIMFVKEQFNKLEEQQHIYNIKNKINLMANMADINLADLLELKSAIEECSSVMKGEDWGHINDVWKEENIISKQQEEQEQEYKDEDDEFDDEDDEPISSAAAYTNYTYSKKKNEEHDWPEYNPLEFEISKSSQNSQSSQFNLHYAPVLGSKSLKDMIDIKDLLPKNNLIITTEGITDVEISIMNMQDKKSLKICECCFKYYSQDMLVSQLVDSDPATCYHCLFWINYGTNIRKDVDGINGGLTICEYIIKCKDIHETNSCIRKSDTGGCFLCEFNLGMLITDIKDGDKLYTHDVYNDLMPDHPDDDFEDPELAITNARKNKEVIVVNI